jgi:hypothetical protein
MLPKIIFHVKFIMISCYQMINLIAIDSSDFTKNDQLTHNLLIYFVQINRNIDQ